MLKVNNLSAGYEEDRVLENVSFFIEQGQICAIVGSNAAGKTTLLKAIAGTVHRYCGTIEFLGKEIGTDPPHERVGKGIRYVGAKYIFPNMKVEENLELGGLTVAKATRVENMNRVYKFFPRLSERRNLAAFHLSGGEQQMLSIGWGMMSNPKLLMIDEPSLGLAPKVTQQIFELLKELKGSGMTILLVEQNAQLALSVADKAYLMENGRIIMEGKPEEFLKNDYVSKAYLGL